MINVLKKLIVSIILVTSILCNCFIVAVNAEANVTELDTIKSLTYNNVATAYDAVKKAIHKDNPSTTIQWSLVDIDKNGTEDLIIYVGDAESDKEILFFTYEQRRIIDLGKLSGSHSTLYSMNNENHLLHVWAHMGEEIVYQISINNNQIVQDKISERTLTDNEDYITGDKEIEVFDYLFEEVEIDTNKLKLAIENYISSSIKLDYSIDYGENIFYSTAVHIYQLATEEGSNVAYIYVVDGGFSYNNLLKWEVGDAYPAKVTYQTNQDTYTILKIEKPLDGDAYINSINNLFPSNVISEISDTENNNNSIKTDLQKSVEEKANEHFQINQKPSSNEKPSVGKVKNEDSTVAKGAIPQAGRNFDFLLVSISIIISLSIIFKYIINKKYNQF